MREIHIRLIIHDASAVDLIPHIAGELLEEAALCRSQERERTLTLLCARLLSVTRVLRRVQELQLTRQVDVARQLPELCEELRMCFEDGETLPLPSARPLLAPGPFAEGGAVSMLISNAVEMGDCPGSDRVCARFERDLAGERLMLADATPAQSLVKRSKRARRGESLWGLLEGESGAA